MYLSVIVKFPWVGSCRPFLRNFLLAAHRPSHRPQSPAPTPGQRRPRLLILSYHLITMSLPTTPITCFFDHVLDNKLLISQPQIPQQLAYVTMTSLCRELSSGTMAVLCRCHYLHLHAQIGALVGFHGKFAVFELDICDPPGIRFLAILAHWVDLDSFRHDPSYLLQFGGIQLDDRFIPLEDHV